MKRIICIIFVLLLLGAPQTSAAIDESKVKEILSFTKDFIFTESQNSGIFSLQHPETGEVEWFELYGILGDVKQEGEDYVVTVDVDLFGYADRNYLLYFVVKDLKGEYKLDEIKIGPRFVRKDQQKLSIPE